MKQTLNILWADDDSPATVPALEGFNVFTTKSCEGAVDLIDSGSPRLDWVVVDLILPQGKWGDEYFRFPGIALLKYLKSKHADQVGLIAFSVVMTDAIRSIVLEAGAQEGLGKTSQSWHQVLKTIGNLQRPGISRSRNDS